MSPLDLTALTGSVASQPSSGEPADASAFEGALALQGQATPPRGRLATGRVLNAQGQAPAPVGPARPGLLISDVAEMADAALAVPAGPAEVGLVRPARSDAAAAETAPAGPTGETSCAEAPAIVTLTEGPLLVAPTPGDTAMVQPTPGETPLVETGPVPGKRTPADLDIIQPATPGIDPGGILPGDVVLAQGAVLSAQTTVATAPEITPLAVPTSEAAALTDLAETPGPTIEPDAAATASPEAAPDAHAAPGAASTGTAPSDAPTIENGRAADLAKADAARAEAAVEDVPSAGPSDAPDTVPGGTPSGQAGQSAPVRADAPMIQRLSFDAVTQLSAQILRRLEGRSTRFEMELHPADMGRVDVRLEIDDHGQLAARLAFDNPLAGADMRGRIDDLRRQLEDAGFQLADDAFSFADREGARDPSQDNPDGRRRLMVHGLQVAEAADLASQPQLRASMRAGVDVRI